MPVVPNKVDTSKRIVIRKEYFDNINTAITSINEFFTSDFKNKNFPVVDGTFQLDSIMMTVLSWLNNVEPTWVNDVEKVEGVLTEILDAAKGIVDDVPYDVFSNDNNTVIIDHINAFIGYKVLQFIGNNFTDFTKLVNGLYSFELFTKPSQYKECIDVFSQNIPIDEIRSVMGENTYTLFSDEKYVSGVFANKQITLPESLKLDTETTRFSNFTDLDGIEILMDDTVQEAATVNMFTDNKPTHFKYNESDDTFKISKQYLKKVDEFVSSLRKCDTTDDLLAFFSDDKTFKEDYATFFSENTIPFILVKVFTNKKKYSAEFKSDYISSYIKSYDSIVEKNNGAKRFFNYDLFSTFKIDKESTINFISAFLKLDLCNDKSCAITNNALLTIFNIFDSRIYFDILYNLIPEKVKKDKYPTSDLFVKNIRAKINANSRTTNTYKTDADTGNNTSTEVLEYTNVMMKEFGDMSLTDMTYCEQYRDVLVSQINCLGDNLYNSNLSSIAIDNYIGESYDEIGKIVQEGFFANIKNKIDKSKNIKTLEDVEDKLGMGIPSEYKEYLLEYDSDKDCEMPQCIVVERYQKPDKNQIDGQRMLNTMRMKNIVGERLNHTLYYIGYIDMGYIDGIEKDLEICDIYLSTADGIHTKFFSKGRKTLECVASSLSDFVQNVSEMKMQINDVEEINSKYREIVYIDDVTGNEHSYEWYEPMFIDCNINEITLDLYEYYQIAVGSLNSSDCFGEMMRDYHSELCEALSKSFPDKVPTEKFIAFDYIDFKSLSFKKKYIEVFTFTTKFGNNKIELIRESHGIVNIPGKSNKVEVVVNGQSVVTESFVQEMETGDIPAYMRDRISISDANGTSPKVEITDVQLPPDVPTNPIDDLTESIDTKLDTGGDTLDTMLGSGYESNKKGSSSSDGKIVYNITNNYSNSFNRDSNNRSSNVSNDLSSGKSTVINNTNSHNDSSSNKVSNSSIHKSSNIKREGTNNYNNGIDLSKDTDDLDDDIKTEYFTLSSGYTVQEVFAFLESDEPLSDQMGDAGKPPKGDLLTAAMDVDKNTLSLQQDAKRKVQKTINTGKAIMKPVARAKQWLTGIVDSLIKRDEDKVKAEIIENPSYRTTLYKAGRLAIKLGLTGVAFTVSGYLGGAYLVMNASKLVDKERLKKEVQEEFTTELGILDDKIEKADKEDTPESRKAKWQMMRLRNKLQQHALRAPSSSMKHSRSIY